jgi:hypothetical protein
MGESYETHEQEFTCPFCGSGISMVLDLSVPSQTFIEDCEVCCRPIEITYTAEADTVTEFSVSRGD